MELELELFDDNIYGKDVRLMGNIDGCTLCIYVGGNKKVDELASDKKLIEDAIDSNEEFEKIMNDSDFEDKEAREFVRSNIDNLFDKVEYVTFDLDHTSVREVIINNPSILSKKIILPDFYTINDYDKLVSDYETIKNFSGNYLVKLQGNDDYIKIEEAIELIKIIKEQSFMVKQLDLSPMEQVMYIYDQVRNRLYIMENEDEDLRTSRDLNQVVFGEKIVCEGYSNIFSAILTNLGYSNRVVYMNADDGKSGHARNVVYIKDPKYNIDGVYYFDTTWDRKKKENDNSYLNSYRCFAKTKRYTDYNLSKHLTELGFNNYSINIGAKVKQLIRDNDYEHITDYMKTINYMSDIVLGKHIIEYSSINPIYPTYGKFDSDLLDNIDYVCDKFNKEIDAKTYLDILYNVRKKEYYLNPEWYPFSVKDFYETYQRSHWDFDSELTIAKERLLKALFGEQTVDMERNPQEDFDDYIDSHDIANKIEQVKLTRSLRNVLNERSR